MIARATDRLLWFVASTWLLIMAIGCAGTGRSGATSAFDSPRKDIVLGTNWRFIRQDVPHAQTPAFDDANWQQIALPHTWNALDGQDGGNNYYRGRGWYRLHLPIDPADLHRELFLRFEGASLVTQVYVNGQLTGTHRGGFGAFCFDVTKLLHAGDNVLAVCVDNTHLDDLPPLSADFTFFGGLYRNVHLLSLNPVNISPTDDASPGVYLKPTRIDADSANVDVTVKVRNDDIHGQNVVTQCTIKDAAGAIVATDQVQQSVGPRSNVDASLTIKIPQPRLWNGRSDPYLYQATVELKRADQVVDRVVQPLGLRKYSVDSQLGLLLNGKSYPLRGVCVHQDYADKGWATSPADIDKSYSIINEMGANAVRLAHYQHPEYEYSLCDRDGIVVWAELAMVNRVADLPAFSDSAKQQLRELIKQNYNHPSIFFWSLYNELGPRTRPDWSLVREVNDLAHQLDPDRITVAASHLPSEISVNWIPDIIAFNRYFGWYSGGPADWARELDALHAGNPDRAFGISEYGAGAAIGQHEERMTTRPSTKGFWHPEEWQATVHEAALRAINTRPFIWGTFVWVMFDFASDERAEGDHHGRNDKGLVTADRLVKKDAFYFYKANWSSDPFVHITSSRYTPRRPGLTQVKVYSNCQSVDLYVNGQYRGKRSNVDHVFVWSDIELKDGTCEVRAIGLRDGKEFTDECSWETSPTATTKPTTFPSTMETTAPTTSPTSSPTGAPEP